MFDRRRSEADLTSEALADGYHAGMTGSAFDVAAAIRSFQPDVPQVKLQKLLYYCQGHHLAATGEPLFRDTISAYDMGPVVGTLWRAEKDGTDELRAGDAERLDEAQLNTVGYVMHRYGGLHGRDLIRLSHAEPPWQDADRDREPGKRVTITPEAIEAFFAAQEEADRVEELSPTDDELDVLLSGADQRRTERAQPDSIIELQRRLHSLQ